MENINHFSVIGLILDMIGVIILFYYGMPSDYQDYGGSILLQETLIEKKERESNNCKIKLMSRIGLAIIFLGFVLQAIGCAYN